MIHKIGHRGILQPPEIMKSHPDRILMRPRIEFDEFVMFELHITVDGHSKETPKRRHRANFAGREFGLELGFSRDSDIFGSRDELEVSEIHHTVGRCDRHSQQAIPIHNDGLRHLGAGNMNVLGSFCSGVGGRMDAVFVDGLTDIEKLLQSF